MTSLVFVPLMLRILSEGRDRGNETLMIALGILSGMFENGVPASVDACSVAAALDKMEAEIVEMPLKER